MRRIGFVCELLSRNGVVAIAATISPYRAVREELRARIRNFVEVHVDCPLEVLVRRDVKGLYKKALAGEIANFTGISDPYEPPLAPEVTVNTPRDAPDQSATESWLHWNVWVWFPLIDLHTHTNESDGTYSPAQLIREAVG